ncbi:MAG: ATP-binding cassette domain-containing protein [Beijerinckiaceae bacterium]|nr:ATP-binding cassette domain-containing protein [Beijerinckiaceae bacterium]
MTGAAIASRRWFAPEVIQTSLMDCGPASLKCLLEGFRIPVSYGRLREACQTGVDGTSVDAIEQVASDMGLNCEQVMLPGDYVVGDASSLPALVAVRQSGGATHFVVAWRKVGEWLQVMDPATGRRWMRASDFLREIYIHEHSVGAQDWRAWAFGDENLGPIRQRLRDLGASAAEIDALIARANEDALWFAIAALEASVRLACAMRAAGGIAAGRDAVRLIDALLSATTTNTDDIYTLIAEDYWSVAPDPRSAEYGERRLLLRGAVLVRVTSRNASADPQSAGLSRELKAALRERAPNPFHALWRLLRADGVLAPLAVAGALCVGASAVVVEALLFRGLFDLGSLLSLSSQRLAAVSALVVFLLLMLAFRLPITSEAMRFGRRLDVRVRMALMGKLSRLNDRYFQSRPVSDMAERAHSLHALRGAPGLGVQALQTICELALTLGGLAIISPPSALIAAAVVVAAIAIPLAFQPLMNEADLRMRSHASALGGVQLDALLGAVPIRVHGAQGAVASMHESLLVEWSKAMTHFSRLSLLVVALQQAVCLALACGLVVLHFSAVESVSGADLLLVFWTLKLPAIGHALVSLAFAYPAQRNVLLRILEPMSAPEEPRAPASSGPARPRPGPVAIDIEEGCVLAGGHTILRNVNLSIAAGEHVAIVGPSGAGKSSLLGLLLGWHSLASGALKLNGSESDGAQIETLRKRTAWVDPSVQLWNASFLENLTFSTPGADLTRVGEAIASADLLPVLQKLPDGLQTSLGDGGAALSGGEGQRLRLGRAFMQEAPDLALLDEPFRGLDRAQRARLLKATRERWRTSTLLCVSHDIVETMIFDRVIVVEDGEIVEDGTPAQLAAASTRYSALLNAEQQARREIWGNRSWRRLEIEDGHVADLRQI